MVSIATSAIDPTVPYVMGSFLKMPSATPARFAQVLEQPIEFVQSLDLVQTTVCATMSTVAFLRGLFPDDCYRTHEYDIEDPNYSYMGFMNATDLDSPMIVNKRKKLGHMFTPWRILVRGKNKGADKLLDWIELGMTDALSQKYLATMQLSIYDGEVSLDKRLEAYIMVFSYTEAGAEMTLHLSGGKGLPSPPGKTISSAKQDIRYLVHRLTKHIGGFPALSPHSIVNMHLTYNEMCPPSYEPLGFVTCRDQSLILESEEGAAVGAIYPRPHSVNLRVFLKESDQATLTSMVTLRGRAKSPLLVDIASPKEIKNVVTQEVPVSHSEPHLANLHPTQKPDQQLSQLSNITSALNTQERGQISAIDSMVCCLGQSEDAKLFTIRFNQARLRFAQNDPHDTQIIDVIASMGDSRHGSIDLDGESTVYDGSSTQGTPSTVGGRRSARLALRSTATSPPKALSTLRPRKRQATPAEQLSAKLRKVSEARSPFKKQRSIK